MCVTVRDINCQSIGIEDSLNDNRKKEEALKQLISIFLIKILNYNTGRKQMVEIKKSCIL